MVAEGFEIPREGWLRKPLSTSGSSWKDERNYMGHSPNGMASSLQVEIMSVRFAHDPQAGIEGSIPSRLRTTAAVAYQIRLIVSVLGTHQQFLFI